MSKEADPRVATKEMIVTRFKSAQQKRKLRDKDRSMIKMTQLLKSPPKANSNKMLKKVKSPKSLLKSKEKHSETKSSTNDEADNKEYYPNKVKRVPGQKKVFLKPKPELKMVARTNKRKFNTPKRGVKSPLQTSHKAWPDGFEPSPAKIKCQSPVYSELSMEEVIRIVEDTQSLDDDDLMEILTCPSPVWWEEPPDDDYVEEAICTRNPVEGQLNSDSNDKDLKNTENNSDDTDLSKLKRKDEKFIKKSKKLENVLGNIRNKVVTFKGLLENRKGGDKKANCDIFAKKEDTIPSDKEKQKSNKGKLYAMLSQDRKHSLMGKNDTNSQNTIHFRVESPIETPRKESHRKVKKISESTEEDLDFPDDEMLIDLENMDIPTGNMCPKRESESSDDVIFINDDDYNKVTYIEDDDGKLNDIQNTEGDNAVHIQDNLDLNAKSVKKELLKENNDSDDEDNGKDRGKSNTKIIVHDIKIKLGNESKEVMADRISVRDEIPNLLHLEVPKNLPPLIQRPKFHSNIIDPLLIPPPNTSKSISDDTTEVSSGSSHEVLDTISDTNIKFIMDDDIDYVSDTDVKNDTSEVTSKIEIADNKEIKKSDDISEESNDKIQLNDVKKANISLDDLKSNKDTYITVYKIVPNDDENKCSKFKSIPEYSNFVQNLNQGAAKQESDDYKSQDCKGQLNSFFKKCKNANRKKCKTTELKNVEDICESCEPKKSITVAQEENVKYCLKCSAIFDTEECSFCLQSQKADSETNYVCDICDFEADTKIAIKSHLADHDSDNAKKNTSVNHVRDIH